ncbi:VanW family protein [Pseudomonas mandelii]|uniref:VanW family protein n=1 Tax=Pseudomonas mandelii TaxID=75612 RepID=UPI00029ADB8F
MVAIQSPLLVVERSNHSFDRFPDDGRVLPFGSGAAIFYNYVDLVLHNPTDRHFQLKLKLKLNVGEQQLEGELLCDRVRGFLVSHLSGWHRFLREGGRVFRGNEIWREVRSKAQGSEVLGNERLYRNWVVVKYEVGESLLVVNG